MTALILAFALAANPTQVQLAAPDLTGPNVSAQEQTFYTDHLAQQLEAQGVRVTTSSQIQQLLGFERQKQLMGCSDAASSCMAELANALGVDGLVTGSIGKIGKTFQINLKIIAAENGAPLAAFSARVKTEEDILDQLTLAAGVMSKELFVKLGRGPTKSTPKEITPKQPVDVPKVAVEEKPKIIETVPSEEQHSADVGTSTSFAGGLRPYAWIPAAAGVAVAGAGAYFLINGNNGVARINAAPDQGAAKGELDSSRGKQQLGVALIGVGAAAMIAGGAMFALGGTTPSSTTVSFVPGPNPSLSVAGSFELFGGSR